MMASYLDLLDHQSRKGIPREGRVITAKAAQSSWRRLYFNTCKMVSNRSYSDRSFHSFKCSYQMCRELPLVVTGSNNHPLARIRGETNLL